MPSVTLIRRVREDRAPAAAALSCILSAGLTFAGSIKAQQSDFPGWQGMRVILQDGEPQRMRAADLDADGRDELIVVNQRQARLEVYRWLPSDRRAAIAAPPASPDDNPNELPMAPQFDRLEVPLEQIPVDVTAADLGGAAGLELIVLVSTPNKVLVFERKDGKTFSQRQAWDLPVGNYQSHDRPMILWSPTGDGAGQHLLISFAGGTATLPLTDNARPGWLEPRETLNRAGWWLADADGDGDGDLVEWNREADRSIRWYERVGPRLLPAQVLHDQPVTAAELLAGEGGAAELILLGGQQEGILRRYAMERGKENELGRRDALPLTAGDKAVWTGVDLGGGLRVLAAVDPEQPRLIVHGFGPSGWEEARHYPIIAGVQGMASVAASPGELLLWAKDGGDLYVSRWDGSRFTYPQPMGLNEGTEDRLIVALDRVGDTTWWAQRVEKSIDLFVRGPDDAEPRKVRFEGVGDKVDKAAWLGGERLLIQAQFARNPRLAVMSGGKAVASEPARLKQAKIEEFGLFQIDGALRAGRAVDGVLQWLNEELHPTDQVMLPEGQRLAGYAPIGNGRAWALERGGQFVHLMEPDEAGIGRVTRSIRLRGGSGLRLDGALGLMLVTAQGATRLIAGRPTELLVRQSIDSREGRPSGVRESTIHRILTADVTGAGRDELILCDDKRHQLTVMTRREGDLAALLSWPVFDDRTYPYGGGEEESLVSEPRSALGLDLDGDGGQDLALLTHDRLVIYLHREQP